MRLIKEIGRNSNNQFPNTKLYPTSTSEQHTQQPSDLDILDNDIDFLKTLSVIQQRSHRRSQLYAVNALNAGLITTIEYFSIIFPEGGNRKL